MFNLQKFHRSCFALYESRRVGGLLDAFGFHDDNLAIFVHKGGESNGELVLLGLEIENDDILGVTIWNGLSASKNI